MPSIRGARAMSTRWLRQHAASLQIVVSVVLIGAIVVVGILWFQHRRSAAAPGDASANGAQRGNEIVSGPPPPPAQLVCGGDAELLAMNPRDKLAQLLMVGVTGADDARHVVQTHHVGGIFIGSWTDKSLLADGSLRDIANSAGPLPLAVSVDEEGGRVDRLASLIGPAPSARWLAASKTPLDTVYEMAKQRGQDMAAMGITIDFAPVVDVSSQPDDEVIGDRSFSDDPEVVTQYAGEYARGLHDAGLLPVFKHFPGHGRGSGDTHTGSATTPSLDQLKRDDLIPYQRLLPADQDWAAVMVGHLLVPGLPGNLPTSLNPAAYNLLRDGGYGGPPFGGPVFTDDLSSMQAISDSYGVAAAVLMALQAGADTALWITTDEVPAVLDRLVAAMNSNELTQDRVNEALLRVAKMKGPNPRC